METKKIRRVLLIIELIIKIKRIKINHIILDIRELIKDGRRY